MIRTPLNQKSKKLFSNFWEKKFLKKFFVGLFPARVSNTATCPSTGCQWPGIRNQRRITKGIIIHPRFSSGFDMDYFSGKRLSNKLKTIFIAIRPWSFSASITSTFLGYLLAWKVNGAIDSIQMLFTTASILFIHGAGNLVNTYYDFANGFDTKDSDDKALVKKDLTPNEIVACIGEFYFLGMLSFLVVYLHSEVNNISLVCLFLSGVFSSFVYTGGIGLKYIAFGDVLIFLTFGFLTTAFAYFAHTGKLSMDIISYALPMALNTEAILHG